MLLPFLKEKKWPRIAKPMEEKSVGLSSDEQLEEQCVSELMEACASKDAVMFRRAVEALVLSMFEFQGEQNAS
jgi:hypothetical protein